ncbi:hypothetical protein [Nocardia cyriacigeorgica]|uniref:Uncharacterized protein n=1 Tax=Nocardia cyriacigeorgica TaxID=135487 RepID=A0A6P1D9A3_9NOCA|nr:hypothetical protein [Nocardia cyriacigeorgica]NEW41891.1 hypothetical protein [Nocardia cyriacigeorgica]NEW46131.1 hypothetical protein [Nocardia cyriacigeorgica]
MASSGIADRATDRGAGFSTSEIRARIKEMFDARTQHIRADGNGSRDRDEGEP